MDSSFVRIGNERRRPSITNDTWVSVRASPTASGRRPDERAAVWSPCSDVDARAFHTERAQRGANVESPAHSGPNTT